MILWKICGMLSTQTHWSHMSSCEKRIETRMPRRQSINTIALSANPVQIVAIVCDEFHKLNQNHCRRQTPKSIVQWGGINMAIVGIDSNQ